MKKFRQWLKGRMQEIDYSVLEAVKILPDEVERAQQGSPDPEFWQKVNEMLTRFLMSKGRSLGLNHADVEDVAQEAMIRLMTKLDSIEHPAAFTTVAVKTAHRLAINHARSRGRMRSNLGGGKDLATVTGGEESRAAQLKDPDAIDPAQAAMDKEGGLERSARLKQILDGLPEQSREMLTDFYIKGMRYTDMFVSGKYTTRAGEPMPIGTIKRNLNIARDQVRAAFGGNPFGESVYNEFDWQTDLILRIRLFPYRTF